MFIGEFSHTIDAKGRVAVPFRFRRGLGKGAVITRSTDTCLVIYPKEEWTTVAQKLSRLPMFDPKAKALSRFIFSGAVEVEFDRQGRALIPQYLRQWAGLKKQVVVTGIFNKIEIWDEVSWKAQQKKDGVGSAEFDKQIQELGI